jgi:ATP-dependent helicase/nuclease subunit A
MTTAANASSASGLRLVSASAGSGKTYRLTEEVTHAVDPSASASIEIEGLVGVTYTTKAHIELEARIRRKLVEKGAFQRAQQLPLAYVGTVHAVCLRILKEFALDAGLSPTVDVIQGNDGRRLLQATLEHALEPTVRSRLEDLALEFKLEWDARTSRTDWVIPVDEIMTLARSNRIAPADLPKMARRSMEGLSALLPPPERSGSALESELASSLATAVENLAALDDETKATGQVLQKLRAAEAELAVRGLPWETWAMLAKLSPSKHAVPFVVPVREAASAYERHPRFHAGLRELTELLFEAARVGLLTYAEWKAQRGLVDYVDMIDRALDVLGVPEVARELGERLELVVVDEFQDTSPIQLALFTRLHALCKNSVWVGDRKQCIFEYAGADPALMEAVTQWAEDSGGKRELLTHNYRSRPELVDPLSTLFAAAFAGHGCTPEEVVTSANRKRSPGLDGLAAIGVWWLEGSEQGALAEGVARLLEIPDSTPVVDRISGDARGFRASDVAILVCSNAEAARLAIALEARGIATVLPRVGLLTTPEGTLVSAALRLLVDRRDTLAAAEIDALTGFDEHAIALDADSTSTLPSDRWLAERIRAHGAKQTSPEQPPAENEAPRAAEPAPFPIECLRAELAVLSPAETLDRVLAILDLPALAVRWPDPSERLANLDALRALAVAYEQRCAYQREAASLAGLLRYFEETQQKIRQRDEERATDEQHVGSNQDAVVISTYHKAKGLEWPVVILGSLGRNRKRDAFEVTPESDRAGFDAADPLGARWIRYWPWPLGQQKAVALAERAANTAVGKAIAERDARERVRLLYVGCTRARDHLILGVHLLKKGPSKAWLDELRDERGPLLTLPEPGAEKPALGIRGLGDQRLSVPVRAWSLQATDAPEGTRASHEPCLWFARASAEPSDAPPYRIAPSRAADDSLDLPPARVLGSMRFTRRMPFATPKGVTFDQVGTALHAFLAADHFELMAAERIALAERVFRQAGLDGFFAPDVAVAASDALRAFVAERWPGAQWRREVPVSAVIASTHGRRRIEGAIDLLLDTPNGFVIIDHKSFPGRASEWEQRALGYAPQLMTYAKAIEMAGGALIGRFVHFTIGGGIVEVGEARE